MVQNFNSRQLTNGGVLIHSGGVFALLERRSYVIDVYDGHIDH